MIKNSQFLRKSLPFNQALPHLSILNINRRVVGTNSIQTTPKELHKLFQEREHIIKITDAAVNGDMKFIFTPPNVPHFGGIWEAAIKSTERNLRKMLEMPI